VAGARLGLRWSIGGALLLSLMACGQAARSAAPGPESETVDLSPDLASGGSTSTSLVSRESFLQPADSISDAHRRDFMIGQAIFKQNWVAAPSNNRDHQGLGPLFNAQSCSACHAKGGRGGIADAGTPDALGLVLRLSRPGVGVHGAACDEPGYGAQFHPHAISGIPVDGILALTYAPRAVRLGDGTLVTLRVPSYALRQLNYGALCPGCLVSPRVALPLIGLGLLEAIPATDLLDRAAATRHDPDGVRGTVNRVWDVRSASQQIGRFGWKAEQPTLEQQLALAFNQDIGLTTTLFPHENTPATHVLATGRPSGGVAGGPEVSALQLERLNQWVHLLAVPMRRHATDRSVQHGQQLFHDFRCDACHVATQVTGMDDAFPELAHQVIHPYTDLLLHDMGPGLADGRPVGAASGAQWRTAPLWGIGLTGLITEHRTFLHDGRARDLTEAVLWHDGEAQAARRRFGAASRQDRDALIAFMLSL